MKMYRFNDFGANSKKDIVLIFELNGPFVH